LQNQCQPRGNLRSRFRSLLVAEGP
jgi:hypothetical protein